MSNTTSNDPIPQPDESATGTGIKRPDQGGANHPAENNPAPATGGDGASGAGGPDGFGTGS